MADKFSAIQRSEFMSHNKGRNTSIELIVRSLLHNNGFWFRLHQKNYLAVPVWFLKNTIYVFLFMDFFLGHQPLVVKGHNSKGE